VEDKARVTEMRLVVTALTLFTDDPQADDPA
jgi:hypothetical protein